VSIANTGAFTVDPATTIANDFAVNPGGTGTDEFSVASGSVRADATFVADASGGADELTVNSTGVAFNGQSPAARPDYTCTNATTDRTIDANATTLDEVADVLCTVIADQIAIGLFQ
jgi:hypothetical protein